MANTIIYSGVAFILISLLFLVAWIQNSIDENRLLATPSIPKRNAVLTSVASARISAPADEVFKVMLNYKNYEKWSRYSGYKWKETTEDGAPLVGSTGSIKLAVEGFNERILPVRLTALDREKRILAERTTSYPIWLLGSERAQEVVPVEGHPRLCEYRTWHTLEGLAAYALLLTVQPELDETQRIIADGLKGFIEKSRAKTI